MKKTLYEVERQKFLSKWNGKTLEDAGSIVSSQYRRFQADLASLFKVLASVIGCKAVRITKGHYFTSCFIKDEKSGECVYIYCGQAFGRTHIDLNKNDSFYKQIYIRTAKDENDWQGGVNHFVTLDELGISVIKLFVHKC